MNKLDSIEFLYFLNKELHLFPSAAPVFCKM